MSSNISYLQDSSKQQRCHRCREYGHKTKKCRNASKSVKCIICAEPGHTDARCPRKICTGCGSEQSLTSTTYCSNCVALRNVKCRVCSQYGHADSMCPDLWRRYLLTTTPGPLKQLSEESMKPKDQRWCSGCAGQGHFEFECNYINRTHPPCDPTIHSYENIYVNPPYDS